MAQRAFERDANLRFEASRRPGRPAARPGLANAAGPIPIAVFETDASGKVKLGEGQLWDRLERDLGVRMVGWSLFDRSAPRPPGWVVDAVRRALAGETVNVTVERLPSAYDYELTCVPVWDRTGTVVGVTGVLRDVTELRRLTLEQARLARAVEASGESIVITDTDARIVYVNPQFETVTGYSREEALGANPRILKADVQDEDFYRAMWATLLAGRTWSGEFVNRRKDGSLYREVATISPVHDAGGALVNYVAVKRDVTHERAIEEHLRQAAKLEAVGLLAGGVAHDFNNLLTAIRGFGELARLRAVDDLQRADLDEIVTTADRAASIVHQLLAFARQAPAQPRVIDPGAHVETLMAMLQRLLGEDVELVFGRSPEPVAVRIDPSGLEQIVVNLVVNAGDAMATGGRVTINVGPVELDGGDYGGQSDVAPGLYSRLTIADTGPGIEEATLARMYDPFFTTKGVGRGTGLGLATVFGIVTQAGGFIGVESRPGEGTRFDVHLPAVDARPEPEPPAPHPALVGTGRGTVLLAEDDDAVRAFARRILEANGYRVVTAATGAEALAVASDRAVDLLVTDLRMPGMDGRELAERLRAGRPGLPVLFVSGYPGDSKPGIRVEPDEASWLFKPFDGSQLLARVRALTTLS